MALQQELDDFRLSMAAKAPERATLYDAKVEELRRTFRIDSAIATGDRAPDFTLPDAFGVPVSLSDRLSSGPAVVIFYRGGWCPYCNLQLRAYQRVLAEITALGGRLLALSPQAPDGSLSTVEAYQLGYDVLSDVSNRVAHQFGIAYQLPPELQAAMTANGKALPGINGDESWELPLTATYVIVPDRTIVLAAVELDYRRRVEPEDVLTALRALQLETVGAAPTPALEAAVRNHTAL
jgi:peroxiredoxin